MCIDLVRARRAAAILTAFLSAGPTARPGTAQAVPPTADSATTARGAFEVDRRLPRAARQNPDAVAVVIGNRMYASADVPPVDYATRDAQSVRRYLVATLGYAEENVLVLDNARKLDLERMFGVDGNERGRLFSFLKPGQSDVFVYYSGHGAPDVETGRSYLVPSDADPRFLAIEGYPLQQLYANLARLPARSLTVVIDACFSGNSARGPIVKGASGGLLRLENPLLSAPNAVLFTASAADQVSSWHDEQQHGLFTYYFLKGLQGQADADGDSRLTAAELDGYLERQVPYVARRLWNRSQTPQFVATEPSKAVLARYGGEFVDVEPPRPVGALAASSDAGAEDTPVTRADRVLAERAIRAAVDSLAEYVRAAGQSTPEPVYRLRPGVDPDTRERFLRFVKDYRPSVSSVSVGELSVVGGGGRTDVTLGLRWRDGFGVYRVREVPMRAVATRVGLGVWRVETVHLTRPFP